MYREPSGLASSSPSNNANYPQNDLINAHQKKSKYKLQISVKVIFKLLSIDNVPKFLKNFHTIIFILSCTM